MSKTIGLCMIVKNEAHVITRCLDSVRPFIDYVLIEDTGSTDGTQDIIRAWLERNGIAGEVVDEPWRDFAYNRSHVLACLRKNPRIDYALVIDADDSFFIDDDFDVAAFKRTMSAEFYDITIAHANIRHHRPHILSNHKAFIFRGVLHEFVEAPADVGARETVEGFGIRIDGGGARSRDPETYRKDARLLERALQEETDLFLRSRYTFYLAQSYRDCGEHAKAIDCYLTRAELGFWQDEVFISLYWVARLKELLEHPEDDVIAAYLRAADAQPARAEALHGASHYCRLKGRNQQGAEIARRGIDLPTPASGLFIEIWVYEYGLLDEFAVNAYWAGDYQGSLDACNRILASTMIDDSTRARVMDNVRFAKEQIERLGQSPAVRPASTEAEAIAPALPRVLLAILAKNKAGQLPLFLECIEALDYPPERLVLHVRTNNNTDATAEILRAWLDRVGDRYAHVEFDDTDVPERVQDFGEHEWNATRFSVLGRIRQHSMERALALQCGFYFVADVDNFIRPPTLRRLVEVNLPIVAPLLRCVDADRPLYSNFHHRVDENGYFLPSEAYGHILDRTAPGLHEVAVVHCTYLVRADAIPSLTYDDRSARYEYVIFSDSARRAGIAQILDTREVWGWLTFAADAGAVRPLIADELAQRRPPLAQEALPLHNERRSIRLKEYPPNASLSFMPAEAYVAARGGSLERKAYRLETDAQGFIRGPGAFEPARHSVIVLGDSVVESMYLEPHERFPARLEFILRREQALDVRVRNGGYSGATSLHMLNVFLNKIVPMKPDLVILMIGIVDVDVANLAAGFWSRDCWIEPMVEPGATNSWRDAGLLAQPQFEDRRRLLDLFSAAARAFGIELWFATIPHQQHGGDPVGRRDRLAMNEVTRAAARAGGHQLCDLESQLAGRADIFHDMFHLNRIGSEAVARALAEQGIDRLLGGTAATGLARAIGEVHVINLDRSPARWEKFQSRNRHLGAVTRFRAVDGTGLDRAALEAEGMIAADLDFGDGALGCALSHIRLWEMAVAQEMALTVLEDDTICHPAFHDHAAAVMAQLPEDWDIVLWGYVYDPLFVWVDLGFSKAEMRLYDPKEPFSWPDTVNGYPVHRPMRLNHVFGTQGYTISPHGARHLLADALPLRRRLVAFSGTGIVNESGGIDVIASGTYPSMNSYCCMPPLVVHRDDGSSDRLARPDTPR